MKILKSRFRLALRLDYIVAPVEPTDLLPSFQKLGYAVPSNPLLPAGVGFSLEPAPGPIAQLGDARIDVDVRRGIFGAETSTLQEALTMYQQLLDILRSETPVDLEKHTMFTEFIADLSLASDTRALESIRRVRFDLTDFIAKSFSESVAPFSIRFGSKEHEPSDPNWFDLRIEPLLRNPSTYFVGIVYRSTDPKKVLKLAEGSEDSVASIIESIESLKEQEENPEIAAERRFLPKLRGSQTQKPKLKVRR